MGTLKDDLIAAKALIDTPEKWGKGSGINPPRNGCHCIITAVPSSRVATFLRDFLPGGQGAWPVGISPVVAFNDHPNTTHADIMALFDRAIAAADEPALVDEAQSKEAGK